MERGVRDLSWDTGRALGCGHSWNGMSSCHKNSLMARGVVLSLWGCPPGTDVQSLESIVKVLVVFWSLMKAAVFPTEGY